MTVRAFCRQIGMKENNFYYWQARIRRAAARWNGEFLPVSIINHSGKVVQSGGQQHGVSSSGSLLGFYCQRNFTIFVIINLGAETKLQI